MSYFGGLECLTTIIMEQRDRFVNSRAIEIARAYGLAFSRAADRMRVSVVSSSLIFTKIAHLIRNVFRVAIIQLWSWVCGPHLTRLAWRVCLNIAGLRGGAQVKGRHFGSSDRDIAADFEITKSPIDRRISSAFMQKRNAEREFGYWQHAPICWCNVLVARPLWVVNPAKQSAYSR